MRIMRGLAGLLVATLIAGCSASAREGWTKPGMTQQELDRDTADCLVQAQSVVGSAQGPRTSVNQDRYRRCMQERGYTLGPAS